MTRSATTIEILHDDQRLRASSPAGSVTHDLCVLTVETLHLPPVAIRSSHELNIGERVTALGFEHGKPVLMTAAGAVRGLYGYDDGFVIRTSASFDFGSSGGGLFDESGRLIGILAFKARTGSDLHFALPADWLDKDNTVAARFESIDAVPPTLAFWEQSPTRRPTFLGTALREASESQH